MFDAMRSAEHSNGSRPPHPPRAAITKWPSSCSIETNRPPRAAALLAALPAAGPDELSLIRDTLALHPAEAGTAQLRQALLDEAAEPGARLRAACVLSVVDPVPDATWDKLSASLTQALLAEDRHSVSRWIDLLGPAIRALIPELGRACRDSSRDSSTRSTAAEALTEVLVRRPDPATPRSVGRRIGARCVTHSPGSVDQAYRTRRIAQLLAWRAERKRQGPGQGSRCKTASCRLHRARSAG